MKKIIMIPKNEEIVLEKIVVEESDSYDKNNLHQISKLGDVVIEQDLITTIHLPEIISLNQYYYLLLKKDEFKINQNNIYICSSENGKIVYSECNINKLYDELRRKVQNLKHIVVIPNENELQIPDGVFQDSFSIVEPHSEKLGIFTDKYNLGIMVEKDTIGHEVALQLANFGHLTINTEDNIIVFYIPNQVSNGQINWFRKNKILFEQFNVQGYYFENRKLENINHRSDISLERVLIIENILKEKLITENQSFITR